MSDDFIRKAEKLQEKIAETLKEAESSSPVLAKNGKRLNPNCSSTSEMHAEVKRRLNEDAEQDETESLSTVDSSSETEEPNAPHKPKDVEALFALNDILASCSKFQQTYGTMAGNALDALQMSYDPEADPADSVEELRTQVAKTLDTITLVLPVMRSIHKQARLAWNALK